jgi:hypothetical protein
MLRVMSFEGGKVFIARREAASASKRTNSKPLESNGLAAKRHRERKRRPNSHPYCVFCASLPQDVQTAFELLISLPDEKGASETFYGYREGPERYQTATSVQDDPGL